MDVSPFQAKLQKEIADEFGNLVRTQLTPWAFFNSGHPLKLTNARGLSVSYGGIGFEGSPRDVFWTTYFLPCLEDIAAKRLETTYALCKQDAYFESSALHEAASALQSNARSFFIRMAEIDRRLRGRGYPERVELRPVVAEIARLEAFINRHLAENICRLQIARPTWLARNKWWIAIGLSAAVVAIAGAAISGLLLPVIKKLLGMTG